LTALSLDTAFSSKELQAQVWVAISKVAETQIDTEKNKYNKTFKHDT
jgi:hypothetical protein